MYLPIYTRSSSASTVCVESLYRGPWGWVHTWSGTDEMQGCNITSERSGDVAS